MTEIANYKAVAEAQGALLSMYGRKSHDATCCHKGLYEAAVGCTYCDRIAVQGTAKRAEAEFKNRPLTDSEQHAMRCDGRLKQLDKGHCVGIKRCTKCGYLTA
jgi:hypothetical protein